jgi:hypothetical protein
MATTRTISNAPEVTNWTAGQVIGSSAFTQASPDICLMKPSEFCRAVFQLNSDKVYMHVLILDEDGVTEKTQLYVDLEEVSKNFKLHKANNISFPIMQYESPGLWIYEPYATILVPSGDQFQIRFKAKQGNITVVRGMSEWGRL